MEAINRQEEGIEGNLGAMAGQRLTSQRLLILGLLHEGEHLTADELYQQATEKEPRINLATVYRNLRLFSGTGLIDELHLMKRGTRYFEARSHQRHYHAVCLTCGRILDFNNASIEKVKKAVEDETGMTITDVQLSMAGYCSGCQRSQRSFSRPVANGIPEHLELQRR